MLQNNSKRRSVKWLLLGLALLLIALPLAGCGKSDKDTGKVVATYKGGQVTEKQLTSFLGAHKFFNYSQMYAYYEMMPDFKESMLRQLIAIRLITEDADKKTKEESADQAEKDIKELNDSIKGNADNKKQFDEFLKAEKINTDDLQSYMTTRYTLQKVFEAKYTDEEIKKTYDEAIAKDKNAYITTATVRHILVKLTDDEGKEVRTKEEALKRAQEVQQKLKNGGDWAALAKEYSDDPGSKDNGGQYADADISQWVESFRQHAIEQPLNEVGEPFESEHGYHVMVVEKRNANDFESVKSVVQNQMIGEYFGNYIDVEVPKLITKVDLPKEEAPAEGDAGTGNAGTDAGTNAGTDAGTGNAGTTENTK